MKIKSIMIKIICACLLVALVYSPRTFAANVTWTNANGTNLWSDDLNWSTGARPGILDVAVFNTTSTSNCLIDQNVDIIGIDIQTGYSGTIQQQSTQSISLGVTGFTQNDGSFEGKTGDFSFSGNIFLNGGTFTATSGLFFIGDNYTQTGGTFKHNNGTVIFNGDTDQAVSITGSGYLTLFNVIVNTSEATDDVEIEADDTIVAEGVLTLRNGSIEIGTVEAYADVILETEFDYISATLRFKGSDNATFFIDKDTINQNGDTYIEKDNGGIVTFRNTAGTTYHVGEDGNLFINSGILQMTNLSDGGLHYDAVTLNAGGTLISTNQNFYISSNYYNNGGTFTHSNGTTHFVNNADYVVSLTGATSEHFYNVVINTANNNQDVIIEADDSLVVEGNLTMLVGDLENGNVLVMNDVAIESGFDFLSAHLYFRGSNNATFFINQDNVNQNGHTYIEKDNGVKVTFRNTAGTVYHVGEDGDLYVNSGLLELNNSTDADLNYKNVVINTNGTLLATPQNLLIASHYTNNGGTFTHNNGTVTFDGITDRNIVLQGSGTEFFYDLNIATLDSNQDVIMEVEDSLSIANDLTLTSGDLENGAALVYQNVHVEPTFDFLNTNLWFRGSNDATFFIDQNNLNHNANTYIDKDADKKVLFKNSSNTSYFIGDDGALHVVRGILEMHKTVDADFNYDAIIIEGGTLELTPNTFSISSDYTYTSGTVVHNNGTTIFDAGGDRNFTSAGGDAFYDVVINTGGATKDVIITSGDYLVVENDLSLQNGRAKTGTVKVSGDVDVAVTYNGGSASLEFAGANDQKLNLNGSAATLEGDIILNKSTLSSVVLLSDFTMGTSGQELALTQGYLVSSSSALFTMGNGTTVSGGSSISYVSGPMRKVGIDAFQFPSGKNSIYAPISISAPAVSTDHFTAEYFYTDPNNAGYNTTLKDASMNNVSACEYWILDRTNGSSNVNVTLSWDDTRSCGIADPASIVVARWDGGAWRDHDGTHTGTIATGGTVTTPSAVVNFSPFTLASRTAVNPLPIGLVDFTATLDGNHVDLDWTTEVEINNDYFVVERSKDGIYFEPIGTVAGAGNSQKTVHYNLVDAQPFEGFNYYRLKWVDFEGQVELSDIQVVRIEGRLNAQVTAYPIPAVDVLNVEFESLSETVEVVLYNELGQPVKAQVFDGNNTLLQLDVQNLVEGAYFMQVSTADGISKMKKITVQH